MLRKAADPAARLMRLGGYERHALLRWKAAIKALDALELPLAPPLPCNL